VGQAILSPGSVGKRQDRLPREFLPSGWDGRTLDDAISQSQRSLRERAGAWAGENDPGEIEGVGESDFHFFAGGCRSANMTEQVNCFRPGELLTDESRDETSAANIAAGFHSPQDYQEVSPCRSERFARKQVAEDYAPAIKELRGEKLGIRFTAVVEERPSSGGVPGPGEASPAFTASAFRIDQRPQILEAIGRHKAGGDQLP